MYNFGGRDIDNKGGIDLPARNEIPTGGVSVDIRIGAVNNFNRNADPALVGIGEVSPSDIRERPKSRRRRAHAKT